MALVCARDGELDFGSAVELPLGSASINRRVGSGGGVGVRFEGRAVDGAGRSGTSWSHEGGGDLDNFAHPRGRINPLESCDHSSPPSSTLTPNNTKPTKKLTKAPAKLVKMGLLPTSPSTRSNASQHEGGDQHTQPNTSTPASPLSPSRLFLHLNSSSTSLAPASPASIKRRVSLLGLHLPTLRRAKSEKRLRPKAPAAVALDGDGHRVLMRRTSFPSLRRAREVRSCSDPGHGRCEAGCGEGESGEEEEEGEEARTPPMPVRRTKRSFGVGAGELSDEEEELSSVGHGVSSDGCAGGGRGRGSSPRSYAMEGSGSSYSSYSSIESTESNSTDATSTGSGSPTISLIASTPTKHSSGMPWIAQSNRSSTVTWAAEPEELRIRDAPSSPTAKHHSLPGPGVSPQATPFDQKHSSLPTRPPVGYDPCLHPIRNCHLDTPPSSAADPSCERNPYLTSLNYPAPQPHRYTISSFHYQTVPQPAPSSIGQRLLRRRSVPLHALQPSLPPGAAAPAAAQESRRLAPATSAPDMAAGLSPGRGAGMGGLLRRASASLTGAGGRPLSVVQAAGGSGLGLGMPAPPPSPARERRLRSKSSGYGMGAGLEVVKEDGDGWSPGVMASWATYGNLKVSGGSRALKAIQRSEADCYGACCRSRTLIRRRLPRRARPRPWLWWQGPVWT